MAPEAPQPDVAAVASDGAAAAPERTGSEPASVASTTGPGPGDGPKRESGNDASPTAPPQVPELLADMERRILDAFERKLAFDEAKEKQIDRLHSELQGYRTDLVGRAIKPVLQSLIRLHDDFGKVLDALDREDPAQITGERMLKLLKGFRDDVELALNHNGIHAFTVDTEAFDPRRQRVLRTVETTEPGQVGVLAGRIRPGFEQGETILEKERVAVFAMKQPKPEN